MNIKINKNSTYKQNLSGCLRGLGFNIGCQKIYKNASIEETLAAASVEFINARNNRMAALLVDWISLHYKKINVDKLTRLIGSVKDTRLGLVRIFWCANAQRLLKKDNRFQRLANIYRGKKVCLADEWQNNSYRQRDKRKNSITKMFLDLKGVDKRFAGTCLLIPNKFFNSRPNQILSPDELARVHHTYKYRVMMGPSYRADLWADLKKTQGTSAYALAKRHNCSYRTAYVVKKDFMLLNKKTA